MNTQCKKRGEDQKTGKTVEKMEKIHKLTTN